MAEREGPFKVRRAGIAAQEGGLRARPGAMSGAVPRRLAQSPRYLLALLFSLPSAAPPVAPPPRRTLFPQPAVPDVGRLDDTSGQRPIRCHGTGGILQFTLSDVLAQTQQFYRIRQLP